MGKLLLVKPIGVPVDEELQAVSKIPAIIKIDKLMCFMDFLSWMMNGFSALTLIFDFPTD